MTILIFEDFSEYEGGMLMVVDEMVHQERLFLFELIRIQFLVCEL